MLGLVSTVPAALLSAILVVSGVAKARDPASVRSSFATLRLPAALTGGVLPVVLPWAEIVGGLVLLIASGLAAIVAATAALALFTAYLVVIARAARFDPPVTCGCLGRLGLGVVGRVTIVRNALLVVLAVALLADSFTGVSAVARWLDAGVAGLAWVGAITVTALTAALMVYAGQARPHTPLPSRVDPVELDYERTPIPHLALLRPDGVRVTLRQLAASRARLLVFADPRCGPCREVVAALPGLRTRAPMLGVHLVLSQSLDAAATPGDEWLLDPEGVAGSTFGIVPPAAVLLGADGYLAGGPVVGTPAVLELLDDIAEVLAES